MLWKFQWKISKRPMLYANLEKHALLKIFYNIGWELRK